MAGLINKVKEQMDGIIDRVKQEMNQLFKTLSEYFSREDDAPVKVKTIKDGTRSHEFHED